MKNSIDATRNAVTEETTAMLTVITLPESISLDEFPV
jgi:DNA/RNA-binding domain of Phe-tRNA-synthetase-like protein